MYECVGRSVCTSGCLGVVFHHLAKRTKTSTMWKPRTRKTIIEIFSRYADRRRRLRAAGMSGAGRRAVLLLLPSVLLAEWRERGSCITACLHLNPSMALTTALANSFRLREAAAVVASGGDAGDDGGDPPHVRRRAGRDVWRRDLSPSGALRLTTSALPAAGVCGRRRDLGPQGRVAPSGGARQGPIVSYVLQSAAPTGPSP